MTSQMAFVPVEWLGAFVLRVHKNIIQCMLYDSKILQFSAYSHHKYFHYSGLLEQKLCGTCKQYFGGL